MSVDYELVAEFGEPVPQNTQHVVKLETNQSVDQITKSAAIFLLKQNLNSFKLKKI